ncbi:RmlC-like cupin domain-containing protein [Hypoxylon sp. FL1284]|nr:RmlC-like cupin domain-containing protein [Hypoxylon sp. FL1284]
MASKIAPTPLASLRVTRHSIPAHGLIPNTSIQNKPIFHYHGAFPSATLTPSSVEAHLSAVGVVEPQWRFTMYSTTHFHSTSHELLCVTRGSARLCFGGEDNPGRVEKEVGQGDVLLLPAGVGHRLLEDVSGGFEMVGAYPRGCNWDMCYGKKGEEAKVQNISRISWFDKDPVYGENGPVLEV